MAVTVTTGQPYYVRGTSGYFKGELTDLGGETSVGCYFQYRIKLAATWDDTSAAAETMSALGEFVSAQITLTEGELYEVRAVATWMDGTAQYAYGSTVEFDAAWIREGSEEDFDTGVLTSVKTVSGALTLGHDIAPMVEFDGTTGSYGSIPDAAALRIGTNDFSIEFDFVPKRRSGDATQMWLISKGGVASGGWLFGTDSSYTTTLMRLFFYCPDGGSVGGLEAHGLCAFLNYKVKVERVGTLTTLYINGNSVDSYTEAAVDLSHTGNFILGHNGSNVNRYTGLIRNFKLTIDGSLAGHWPMDEGTGTTIGDNVSTNDGTLTGTSWVNSGLFLDTDNYALSGTREIPYIISDTSANITWDSTEPTNTDLTIDVQVQGTSTVSNEALTIETADGTNLVPDMTSNSAPSGEVTASSYIAGYEPWKAFSQLHSDYWAANGATGWIAYEFEAEQRIGSYAIMARTGSLDQSPKTWTFEGYNDSTSSYDTLHTVTNAAAWTNYELRTYEFAATKKYKKYRLNITVNQGSTGATTIAELFLIERESFVTLSKWPVGTVTITDDSAAFDTEQDDFDLRKFYVESESVTNLRAAYTAVDDPVIDVVEIQELDLDAPAGGTFKLGDGSTWTADLAYNASAATIETALEGLYTAGNVTVTETAGVFTITFAHSVGNSNLTADFTGLT